MAKNFIDISDTLINDANLSRLDLHILGLGYLQEGVSRFMEVITEDEVQEIAKKPEVFDSKEEKKRQMTLWKEKKDTKAAACLSTGRLRRSSAARPVSGLSIPSAFALSGSAEFVMLVPCSSTLPASVRFAGSAIPVPRLSALSISAKSAGSASLMFGLSAPLVSAPSASAPPASAPFASALSAFAPSTSALSTSTGFTVSVPGSAAPFASILSVSAPFTFAGFAMPVSGLSASTALMFRSSTFLDWL